MVQSNSDQEVEERTKMYLWQWIRNSIWLYEGRNRKGFAEQGLEGNWTYDWRRHWQTCNAQISGSLVQRICFIGNKGKETGNCIFLPFTVFSPGSLHMTALTMPDIFQCIGMKWISCLIVIRTSMRPSWKENLLSITRPTMDSAVLLATRPSNKHATRTRKQKAVWLDSLETKVQLTVGFSPNIKEVLSVSNVKRWQGKTTEQQTKKISLWPTWRNMKGMSVQLLKQCKRPWSIPSRKVLKNCFTLHQELASTDVCNDYKSAYTNGDDAFKVFCEERLQGDGDLFKVLKKQKRKTFSTLN